MQKEQRDWNPNQKNKNATTNYNRTSCYGKNQANNNKKEKQKMGFQIPTKTKNVRV